MINFKYAGEILYYVDFIENLRDFQFYRFYLNFTENERADKLEGQYDIFELGAFLLL